MIIGVDLDATAGDYYGGLRKFIALEDKLTPNKALELYPEPNSYDMNTWKDFPEKFKEVHSRAVTLGLYKDIQPFDGVSKILWKLNDEGHHIRIVTSRFVAHGQNAQVISHTAEWLDMHSFPYRDISFVERKGDIYADVSIEDAPSHIKSFYEINRPTIVYDNLYNRNIEGINHDNELRAYNWDDVYQHIQKLETTLNTLKR